MAKQNVFGGKSKKFVFLFLSMVACVLSSLGVISASIQEATPVSADAPTVERDCIGITFVDACGWSGLGNDPYLEIYSITFTSDSPYSSFDEANGHDGLEKVDSKMTYKTYLCWTGDVSTGQGFKFQLPWYVYSCSYLWKMGTDPHYWTDQVSATAGTSYVDKMTAKPDSGDSRKGTLEHGAGATDNLTPHVISANGTVVTEYAVINGTYDIGETLASSNVIQNSKYTVSKSDKVGSLIDYESVTYLLEGYYTNQACSTGKATQFDVGTNDDLPLYANLLNPPVYLCQGSTSTWGTPSNHTRMTTTDGGTTFVYEWEVDSVDDDDSLFKICDYLTGSARWCGTYVSGTSKIKFPSDGYGGCNYRLTETGTYKIIFTPSTTSFTVYCKDATVNVYNVVGGAKSKDPRSTISVYSGVALGPLEDLDPPSAKYEFTGYYFTFDDVFGVSSKWSSRTFTAASTTDIFADFALIEDEFSENIYLISEDTGWSDGHPTSGKMYYKTNSGNNDDGTPNPTLKNPYLYYLIVDLDLGDLFYFADCEHITQLDGSPIVAHSLNNGDSRYEDLFETITVSKTIGGYSVTQAIRCKSAGRYEIFYSYYGSNYHSGFWDSNVIPVKSYVYFLLHTASWDPDNVHCYMYNSATQEPAGGSTAWPGCQVGDTSNTLKVTRTGLIKAKTTTDKNDYPSYVFRVEYDYSIGRPDNLIFNNGTSGGERVGYEKTGNLPLKDGSAYHFQTRSTGTKIDYLGVSLAWLYDFEQSLGNATYNGDNYTQSVCAIINNASLAASFYGRYSSMASNEKGYVDTAVIRTYSDTDPDPLDAAHDVAFTTVIALLATAAGGGASARISAPGSASSPLTVTLWIVLGSGSIGIGLILGAYLVSKKKKKHRA